MAAGTPLWTHNSCQALRRSRFGRTLVQSKSVTLTRVLEEGSEMSAARKDSAILVSRGPHKGQSLE